MLNFIKKHPYWSLIITIFCTMLLAYSINLLLFLENFIFFTHGSDDGDWLSFWGSFLGGIIGGLATLGGVLFTIKQSEQDKLKDKIPNLIPINLIYYILSTQNNKSHIFSPSSEYIDQQKLTKNIHMEILNASNGNAFNCEVKFTTTPFNILKEYLDDNPKNPVRVMRNILCNTTFSLDKIPFVPANLSGNTTKFLLGYDFQRYFMNIFSSIIFPNEQIDIPIGTIKISYEYTLIKKEIIEKDFTLIACNIEHSNCTCFINREHNYTQINTIYFKLTPINK